MKIHEKFKPLWENEKCNYFIITGGRGGAKSFAVSDFLENLSMQAGQRILFTRYTMVSAHLSIIPEFREKIELENHRGVFQLNKTEIINKHNNSAILFRGIRTSSGNQTARLKSIQGLTTFVLDEAEELVDEKIFDTIDESVRQKGVQNRSIIIMNPSTKEHWVYKRYFEQAGVKPGFNGVKDNVCYIHTTYLDNIENLSDKFIREAEKLKESNPAKYAHRYLGEWIAQAEGVIFTNWEFGAFDTSLPYLFGMDFGFNDPDTMVRFAKDEKNKVCYWDEVFYKNAQSVEELKQSTRAGLLTPRDLIVADSANPRLIHELRAQGLNIEPVNKSAATVAEGIKMMLDYKHVITQRSKNLAREFNNYVWNDKKAGIPVDDYNHIIDAGRYGFIKLSRPSAGRILQTTTI